jgi:1-acyl-sn-glycerol-3-phosphate acyltransferase
VIQAWDKTLGSLWSRTNQKVGALEYVAAVPRNCTIGLGYAVYLLFLIVQALWMGEMTSQNASRMAVPAVITFLSVVSHQRFIFASLKIAEFLRTNPRMAPGVFFEWFFQLLGPIPYRLPDPMEMEEVHPGEVDFSGEKTSNRSIRLLAKSLLDTAHLAHICLRNLKYLGPESAREIFDCMATMWGKRTLETLSASFRMEGWEKIEALEGRILLSFNHKSHIDFVLTFFALSAVRLSSGRGVRPRFVTAKDHFVDNIIVYELLGVGRLIETVDMVFIERKKIGKGLDSLSRAARFVVEKPIEIAIFPQGTRALPHLDRDGKRWDAGYYTTFSPRGANDDMGHLRKGLAYLALDVALMLSDMGENTPLHIVNIGIEGTSSMACKGSSSVQTGVPVAFRVGEVVTLRPEAVRGLKKPTGKPGTPEEKRYLERMEEIHHRVDHALAQASRIREHLTDRFSTELRESLQFEPEKIDRIQEALKGSPARSREIVRILDRLYACPPECRDPFLRELAGMLLQDAPQERLKSLRERVTQTLLENLNLKQHGKKVGKGRSMRNPLP